MRAEFDEDGNDLCSEPAESGDSDGNMNDSAAFTPEVCVSGQRGGDSDEGPSVPLALIEVPRALISDLFGSLVERAVEEACWACLKSVLDSAIPGAGSLLETARKAHSIGKVVASVNDGRGVRLAVPVLVDQSSGLGFSVSLDLADTSQPATDVPRFEFDLNPIDPPETGGLTIDPLETVLTPVESATAPSHCWALRAPLSEVAKISSTKIVGPSEVMRCWNKNVALLPPANQVVDLPHVVAYIDPQKRVGLIITRRPGASQINSVLFGVDTLSECPERLRFWAIRPSRANSLGPLVATGESPPAGPSTLATSASTCEKCGRVLASDRCRACQKP